MSQRLIQSPKSKAQSRAALGKCPSTILKLTVISVLLGIGIAACSFTNAGRGPYVIAQSKSYEASIYRQNCAICHGAEAEGKVVDGRLVPSLRSGEFKKKTEAEIYQQIRDGGNGMLPFRQMLTERELQMMVKFVSRDLRGGP